MKIGICALLVHPARFGGAETYARRLIEWLPVVDQENEYLVFVARGSDLHIEAPNFRIVECAAPVANPYRRVLWEQLKFSHVAARHTVDAMHFLGSTTPYGYSGRSVVTIHDTLRYQTPHLASRPLAYYYEWIQRRIANRGQHVIAVSHSDAAIMMEHLKIAPERISVVYHGVDAANINGEVAPSGKDYLLWSGHLYAHKNVEVLFQAYTILRDRGLRLPRLRLVGATDADRRRLEPQLAAVGIADLVTLEDRVSPAALPELYRSALLFCFPSQCESFGLPILESLASGTAVVCSELPCFRELFADDVMYCPANSASSFAATIERLLLDQTLRSEYEKRGRERAQQFTWRRCAEETVQVYRKAIGST